MGKLTWIGISHMKEQGLYGDGGGLYLQVGAGGARSWIYRFTLEGRARTMGLGSLSLVSLAEAREKALECRKLRQNNIDPITARRELKNLESIHKIIPQGGGPIEITSRPLSVDELFQLKMPHVETGIYFLFSGKTLQYIGQSADCRQRIAQHRKIGSIPFDSWRFIPTLMQDLDYVEAAYIRSHSPPYNRGMRRRRMNPPPSSALG